MRPAAKEFLADLIDRKGLLPNPDDMHETDIEVERYFLKKETANKKKRPKGNFKKKTRKAVRYARTQ